MKEPKTLKEAKAMLKAQALVESELRGEIDKLETRLKGEHAHSDALRRSHEELFAEKLKFETRSKKLEKFLVAIRGLINSFLDIAPMMPWLVMGLGAAALWPLWLVSKA